MHRIRLMILITALVGGLSSLAQGQHFQPGAIRGTHMDRGAAWHGANTSWHNSYYHPSWGHPLALIVPPTASMQTQYSWGVGRTTMTPIHHQFGRPYVDPVTGTVATPAPIWPSNTNQTGTYYIRGPW